MKYQDILELLLMMDIVGNSKKSFHDALPND